MGVVLWAAFFIVLCGLFLVNRELIRKTLRDTEFTERLLRRPGKPEEIPPAVESPPAVETPAPPPARVEPAGAGDRPAALPPAVPPPARPQDPPPPGPAAGQGASAPAASAPAVSAPPAAAPPSATGPAVPARPREPPPAPPAERGIYLTQVDRDGAILRARVPRQIPASDSPMLDSFQALLSGPTAEERRGGFISLIPEGTRILSAAVRGSTAYLSFSEDFQYNTYGVEGYAAQLKQVIWTATEFPTVRDVQILIEGRRLDYLGESVWIGSPLGRDSF